jgi:hypothetical protein
MRDNKKMYGFNMAIFDDAAYFRSLWHSTREFMAENGDIVQDYADLSWLLHKSSQPNKIIRSLTGFYRDPVVSPCKFLSNFEAGSLKHFRSEEHRRYFEHLDEDGGFYYDRYGDASVHALSVSMFLHRSEVWFFRKIGCTNGFCDHCPGGKKLPMEFAEDSQCMRAIDESAGLERALRYFDSLAGSLTGTPSGRGHTQPAQPELFIHEVPEKEHQSDVGGYSARRKGPLEAVLDACRPNTDAPVWLRSLVAMFGSSCLVFVFFFVTPFGMALVEAGQDAEPEINEEPEEEGDKEGVEDVEG